MPSRSPIRCTMCPAMATHHGRCETHQRKAWENPSANTRALTGADRARFKAQVFAIHGSRCAWCDEPATDADHILAIGLGGAPKDAANNGQPLCGECHALKTEADTRQIRAKRARR